MRYIKLLMASVMLVSMSACVADNESDLEGYIKTINFVGPDEIAFDQTKATSVENGSALVFRWAAGDTLGIFPNKGNQVEFPITTQESSTSASFDGGGWALRNNASYAAYYPFSVWNYLQNNKTIVLDYSGQVQDGNGSFAHLSAYDYLASAKTTPENGSVTFQMDRQGSILYIDIVVPEPATIISLTISCDEAIFVEKAALDISGDTPEVTPIETKESLTLNFENTATTTQYETVRAYMAVQPVDFSSKTVTATLVTDAGTYTAPVVSRVVNKGKAAFLRFSDSFTENTIPGAVDLGLPSGLKWASCNVGANAPEEYGDYFAWGETEPYYTEGHSQDNPCSNWKTNKTGYDWASYKFELGTDYHGPFSKYVTNSSYGTVDNKTVLDPEDDAAAVNWGGTWRMPTDEEWTELRTECNWTWTTHNGVNGRLVTGPNGNSIFLPAAGSRYHDLFSTGSNGSYWSSSLYAGVPLYAWYVYFNSDEVRRDDYYRCIGRSVRPVYGDMPVLAESISLDKTELELECRETAVLNASVLPENATYTNVTWSSSNESVATVSSSGEVIGIYPGTATITASSPSVIKPATCTVTVIEDANDASQTSGKRVNSDMTGSGFPSAAWFDVAMFKGEFYAITSSYPDGTDATSTAYHQVFKSADGISWTKVNTSIPVVGGFGSRLVVFKDKLFSIGGGYIYGVNEDGYGPELMWGMAGFFDISELYIYSTSDGENWTKETASDEDGVFSGYVDARLEASADKLSYMGGLATVFGQMQGTYNTASSADGFTWNKVGDVDRTSPAPLLRCSALYSFNGKTFLAGGFKTFVQAGYEQTAVYSSTDGGITWVEEAADGGFGGLWNMRVVSAGNVLYMVGGEYFKPTGSVDEEGNPLSEQAVSSRVFRSTDGINWTELTGENAMPDTYVGRSRPCLVVDGDMLWIFGGRGICSGYYGAPTAEDEIIFDTWKKKIK